MFATIFVFGVIAEYVTAELPSYIHVCGRKDSNYNQCIANSINGLKDKVCTGFPELDIPPNEPLLCDKIVIFDTSDIKFYLKDMKVYGLCDFVINSVNADFERLHFDIDFSFRNFQINTTYDFDIRLLVPIAHKGLIKITTENSKLKVNLDLKVITRNGKKYIYASKVNSDIKNVLFKYKFDENAKELSQLHEILNDVITKNKDEVVNAVISALEERNSRFIISLFNSIASLRYEELFPEET